jgi:hypothetical protein
MKLFRSLVLTMAVSAICVSIPARAQQEVDPDHFDQPASSIDRKHVSHTMRPAAQTPHAKHFTRTASKHNSRMAHRKSARVLG